jgi:hypothetical protein
MRRIRTLFSIAMIIATFSNFSNAQKAASFRIEPTDISGMEGDTVTIKVFAKDFKNVLGLQFSVGWDTTVFKKINTNQEIFSTSNVNLQDGWGNCFNIFDYALLFSFISNSLDGNTITKDQDSTLFFFKLVLRKNTSNQTVCFSQHMTMELIYDDNNICKTLTRPFGYCNSIDFNASGFYFIYPERPTVRLFNEDNDKLLLKVIVGGGKPPYNYQWGNANNNSDTITIANLKNVENDTLIPIKVLDSDGKKIESAYLLKKYYKTIVVTKEFYKSDNKITIKIDPDFGTKPYSFNWGNGFILNSDSFTVTNPIDKQSITLYVKDSNNKERTYYINFKLITEKPLIIESIFIDKFEIDATKMNASVIAQNGHPPYLYLWNNGDINSNASYILNSSEKSKLIAVTITDSKGEKVNFSKMIFRDTIIKSKCLTSILQSSGGNIYFSKNPTSGKLIYSLKYFQNKKLLKESSGETSENFIETDYTNQSYFDVNIELTYKLEYLNFSSADTTVSIIMKNTPLPPFKYEKEEYIQYCKIDQLILKANIGGGVPPYTYDWVNIAKGQDIDSVLIKPYQSAYYVLNVTDQVGQVATKRFYVSIGKVLEINNVNLSDDNICGNKPLSIYVKRNYTDMDAIFNLEYTYYNEKDSILSTGSKNYNYGQIGFFVKMYSNIHEYRLNLKIKSIDSEKYCAGNNPFIFEKNIKIKPTPYIINETLKIDTLCSGSYFTNYKPLPDPTNLYDVKYKWIFRDFLIDTIFDSDEPFNNYKLNDKFNFNNNETSYPLYTIIHGASMVYPENGCSSLTVFKEDRVSTLPKFNLNKKSQVINNNQEITPLEVKSNFINTNYQLSYINNNLTGSLLDDKDFPLTGKLVNNSNHTQKLAIIVKSSLFGCEGQTDTAYIEVTKGISEHVELSSSDEFTTIYNKSHRNLVDDLGADFEYLLSPNPASNELNFSFKSNSSAESTLGIYSFSGQQMMEIPFEAQKGVNKVRFSIEKLPAGNYILLFKNNENVKTERFVKQ